MTKIEDDLTQRIDVKLETIRQLRNEIADPTTPPKVREQTRNLINK